MLNNSGRLEGQLQGIENEGTDTLHREVGTEGGARDGVAQPS